MDRVFHLHIQCFNIKEDALLQMPGGKANKEKWRKQRGGFGGRYREWWRQGELCREPASQHRHWYEVTALSVAYCLWQTCCLQFGPASQASELLYCFLRLFIYLFIYLSFLFIISRVTHFLSLALVFLTTLISLLHCLDRISFSNGWSKIINRGHLWCHVLIWTGFGSL